MYVSYLKSSSTNLKAAVLPSPCYGLSQNAGKGYAPHASLPSMAFRSLFIVISFSSLAARSEPASMDIVDATGSDPTGSSGLASTSCPSCADLFPRLETTSEGERVQDTQIQLRGGECTTRKLGRSILPGVSARISPSNKNIYASGVLAPPFSLARQFLRGFPPSPMLTSWLVVFAHF